MGTALIKIRLPVRRIALFFIKGLCLPLGMKAHGSASRFFDLPLSLRQQKGPQASSPVCLTDRKPAKHISSLLFLRIETADCRRRPVTEQNQMNGISINFIKFFLEALFLSLIHI